MKINIFYKKRKKSGLSQYDMAKELNIPFETYKEIERGARPMPSNLIDKFYKIINRTKNNPNIVKLEQSQTNNEVEMFFQSLVNEDKKLLDEYLLKFNIKNKTELGRLIGYSASAMCNYLGNRQDMATIEFKKKLYDFFHNELNIQVKEETPIVRRNGKENRPITKGRVVLNDSDIKLIQEYMIENNLTKGELAKELNIPESSFSHYINGRPMKQIDRNKVMNYIVDKLTQEEDTEIVAPTKIDSQLTQEETTWSPIKIDSQLIQEPIEIKVLQSDITSAVEEKTVEKSKEELEEIIKNSIEELNEIREKEEKKEMLKDLEENTKVLAQITSTIYNTLSNSGLPTNIVETITIELIKNQI